MKITVVSILIVCIIFLINIVLSAFPKPPSEPPPLDDPTADYIIQKKGHNFVISYEAKEEEACCIMIGYSPIELKDYVGEKVSIEGDYLRYSDGQFVFTNTQCIAGKCHQIYDRINHETRVVIVEKIKKIH